MKGLKIEKFPVINKKEQFGWVKPGKMVTVTYSSEKES